MIVGKKRLIDALDLEQCRGERREDADRDRGRAGPLLRCGEELDLLVMNGDGRGGQLPGDAGKTAIPSRIGLKLI
jgi:hypothetical protein